MSLHDPDPTVLSDWNRPYDRLKLEAICFARAMIPDEKTFVRTILTLSMMGVWVVATLGPALEVSAPISASVHTALTAVVFLLVGHLWGLEVDRVLDQLDGLGVSIESTEDDSDDSEE